MSAKERFVPTIIDGLVDQWITAVKAKDSAALASLVTEDCIFLAPNAPPMRGRTIVEQLYRNLFARYNLVQSFHFEETQCMGDWAFAWGTDDITMTPVAGGGRPPFRRPRNEHFALRPGRNLAFRPRNQQRDAPGIRLQTSLRALIRLGIRIHFGISHQKVGNRQTSLSQGLISSISRTNMALRPNW